MGKFFEEIFKNISTIAEVTQQIHKGYETIKGRDQTDVQKFDGCGGDITSYFIHRGKLAGPGGRSGRCGYKKDHSRTYCCKACFEAGFHK